MNRPHLNRLVFICPDVLGGVRTYIANLSVFLTAKNVEHVIILYGRHDGISTSIAAGDLPKSTRLLISRFATPQSSYKELAAQCRADDILICNDSFELDALRFAEHRGRIVFVLHGDLKHYDSILQRHTTFIDKVICVSHGLRDKYRRLYPALSFAVCHPVVWDINPVIGKQDQPSLTGLYIGRFEYMKGADTFTEAVARSSEAGMPIRWMVFTTSNGADQRLLDALPPAIERTFDLANDALLDRIWEADFLLFPSRSEGFGIAVLECMKRGVVPIVRNLPIGIPEMIKEGQSGYLVETTDDILRVMTRLNADRPRLRQIKQRTAGFAAVHFNSEKIGEHFFSLIQEVQKKPARMDKPSSETIHGNTILPEKVYRILKYIRNAWS